MTSFFPPGLLPCSTLPPFPLLLPKPHSNIITLPAPVPSVSGSAGSHKSQDQYRSPNHLQGKTSFRGRDLVTAPSLLRGAGVPTGKQRNKRQPCSCNPTNAQSLGQKAHSAMLSASPFTSQQRGCEDINIHVRSSEAPADSRRFREDSWVMRRQHPTSFQCSDWLFHKTQGGENSSINLFWFTDCPVGSAGVVSDWCCDPPRACAGSSIFQLTANLTVFFLFWY